MTKLAYLSSSALCALALIAGVSPAAADGGMGNDLFGTVHFGYDWNNYDSSVISDFNTNTFVASGAVGVPLGNGWSGQLNFAFETQQFDDFGLPISFSIDTWQVGSVIAYQSDQWKGGLDMAYETADFGASIDGYRFGLRGEYFWMPNFTLRGGAGYQDYDTSGFEADGFFGGLGASYYFNRNIGIRLNADYYTYDVTILGANLGDYDVWDFGAKLQYKCDDYPLIFGGHVNYGTIDAFGTDSNVWTVGLDLTAILGTGAANSSLRDAEVNSPFEPQRLGVKYFNF